MGLYGNEKCIYNEHHPNPFYLAKCHNSKVDKEMVKSSFCNACDKAEVPEFNKNNSLEELAEEAKKLKGKKRKMAKKQILNILNGKTQPWEV